MEAPEWSVTQLLTLNEKDLAEFLGLLQVDELRSICKQLGITEACVGNAAQKVKVIQRKIFLEQQRALASQELIQSVPVAKLFDIVQAWLKQKMPEDQRVASWYLTLAEAQKEGRATNDLVIKWARFGLPTLASVGKQTVDKLKQSKEQGADPARLSNYAAAVGVLMGCGQQGGWLSSVLQWTKLDSAEEALWGDINFYCNQLNLYIA